MIENYTYLPFILLLGVVCGSATFLAFVSNSVATKVVALNIAFLVLAAAVLLMLMSN